jgi:quercetin dioxygenase-like cupin family protein
MRAWIFLALLVNPAPMGTTLVHRDETTVQREAWGAWRRHLRGNTAGLKDVALSLFTLDPGQAPHPPHQHPEEELMILVSGSGVWHLGDKDRPARAGVVVYAAPGTLHGLRNTGSGPLDYYVLKWTK